MLIHAGANGSTFRFVLRCHVLHTHLSPVINVTCLHSFTARASAWMPTRTRRKGSFWTTCLPCTKFRDEAQADQLSLDTVGETMKEHFRSAYGMVSANGWVLARRIAAFCVKHPDLINRHHTVCRTPSVLLAVFHMNVSDARVYSRVVDGSPGGGAWTREQARKANTQAVRPRCSPPPSHFSSVSQLRCPRLD